MVVYKFGGASVISALSIKKLAGIVSGCDDNVVIVISAFGKTTNALEDLLAHWYDFSLERFSIFNGGRP